MMLFLLATILELYYDCVDLDVPVQYFMPRSTEIQHLLSEKGIVMTRWQKKDLDHTWMFWNLGPRVKVEDFARQKKENLILFMWEPPVVQPELYDPEAHKYFGKIFTWDDSLIDNQRYFKLFYPALKPLMDHLPPFEEKKFCTMIARRQTSKHPKELYSERKKIIQFFEKRPQDFDLYGTGWKKKYKTWKGPIVDKLQVLKNYKFCIAYENTKEVQGYISEKIFDCFAAGVVPIYWGASNITDYIPENCFIDRRKFKDNESLVRFLKKMTKLEYEAYLKHAALFLQSEKAQVFHSDHFIKTFMKAFD